VSADFQQRPAANLATERRARMRLRARRIRAGVGAGAASVFGAAMIYISAQLLTGSAVPATKVVTATVGTTGGARKTITTRTSGGVVTSTVAAGAATGTGVGSARSAVYGEGAAITTHSS